MTQPNKDTKVGNVNKPRGRLHCTRHVRRYAKDDMSFLEQLDELHNPPDDYDFNDDWYVMPHWASVDWEPWGEQ